jgi:hypothetical protein
MTTPVIVKFPTEARVVNIDFVNSLVGGETITGQSVAASIPAGLTVSVAAPVGSAIPLTVSSGADGQSYGVDVTVTTSAAHTYVIRVAVVVNSQIAANYQNKNVDAFNALVGELEAGEAALGKASFMFPDGFAATGGSVKWEVLDQDGVVLSFGQTFDYQITTLSSGVKVEAQAVVSVPSDAVPTLAGQNYQLRWTLTVSGNAFYSFEALRVTAPNTVPEGVEDVVELAGQDIPISVVFSQPYDTVTVSVYQDNEVVANGSAVPVPQGLKTTDGWLYQVTLSGLDLEAALESYTLIWSAKNTGNPYTERQTGRMFIVNPMILSATDDMRLLVNKSRTTIFHQPDLLFTVPILLSYLRRGRDAFNGAYGVMTAFTFTAAKGPLREYWLRFSEIQALRGQYLAEGEKVFNYSGQEIQLDVDRTQYYDQAANTIQQLLDNECKVFKNLLVKRGILGGDGNVSDLTKQRPGAAGAIGITISPATNFGPYARYRR